MRSPFPGMDPYIETSQLWEDFHYKIIGDIERTLAETLPPRYIVRVGERSYIEYLDPGEGKFASHTFQPDVKVRSRRPDVDEGTQPARAAVAEHDPSAFVMHGLVEAEYREIFLEIREFDPKQRLITSIEVLSPSNKRYGSTGWQLYQRKRQAFLEGYAHLVEIDLLRQGERLPMAEEWPDIPYAVVVLRKEQAPRCIVQPAYFTKPLPSIAIPLAAPDPDHSLDLQSLVDSIYARSHYERDIDYSQPLQPPLSAADQEWFAQRLKEWQAPA